MHKISYQTSFSSKQIIDNCNADNKMNLYSGGQTSADKSSMREIKL